MERLKPHSPEDPEREALVRSLQAVVFDFDGVFTDNRVWVFEDGREAVACDRADGIGLSRLRTLGLKMTILSTETNPVVSRRAEKLKIPCLQGVADKVAALKIYAAENRLDLKRVAFVGNDVNDLDGLRLVGLAVAPEDAYPEVKARARWILKRKGGMGAVREFCDQVWRIRGGET